MRHALLLLAVVSSGSFADAQFLIRTKSTLSTGAQFGRGLSAVGDLDLDGIGDVAISTGNNLVQVYSSSNGRRLFRKDFIGGYSLASAGDLDADGKCDIISGDPFASVTGQNSGDVFVSSGGSGALIYRFHGSGAFDSMGNAVAGGMDVNGDSIPDIVGGIYASDTNGFDSGSVRVWSGATGAVLYTVNGDSSVDWFGRAVALVPDVDGDGNADLLVGAPQDDNAGPNSGMARMFSGLTGAILWSHDGWIDGDLFGTSLTAVGDCDGDGISDVAVGAPKADVGGIDFGACAVLSGATGALLQVHIGEAALDGFGASVAGMRDLDGDGSLDLAVGANLNDAGGNNAGAVYIFSGAVGVQFAVIRGFGVLDQLGYSVAMVADSNGDGLSDLAASAPFSDWGASDGGAVHILAMPCPSTNVYCTAKLNSLGCVPSIGFSGTPSLSSPSGFVINANNLRNNQPGFLLYGISGPAAIPFQGGRLCVGPPVQLGPNQQTGGLPAPNVDCSGSFALDFNSYAFSGAGMAQIHYAGTLIYAQWWSRDPGFTAPNDSSLSDAVRFAMCL